MERFMDLINQLVLEHKKELTFYDIDYFQVAASQTFHEGVADALLPDPSKYCDYIDKILDYSNRVTMTPDQLLDFYSKIYKSPLIDQRNINIPVQTAEEIDKIRPEYLSQVPMEFDKAVKGILNGSLKESDIRVKYVTGEYFNKVRRQLVKTALPYSDLKDLMVTNTTAAVHVTSVYIQSSIIPFLSSYNQNVKDLTIIAENTKGRIYNTYTDIMNSMNAVDSMASSGKLDAKQRRLLSYFRYNMFRQYMNLCAYIVTIIIRKMKYYTFNIMSYTNLYNTISNYFPDGEYILHEYVEGDDVKSLDDTTLLNSTLNNGLNVAIPYIQHAINKKRIELSNLMAKRYNTRLNYHDMENDNQYSYDEQPYAAINRAVMNIANDLHTFEVNSQDPNMIVDDVLGKANMDEPFTSQYTDTLARLDSMDFYTVQGNMMGDDRDKTIGLSLYSELNLFERNITAIARNISKVYHYIESLIQKFETNTNDLDDNTYNEYKSTLDDAMKNFKEFALQVTKKIISRLDGLSTLMSSEGPGEDPSDPTPDISNEPDDYATPAYIEAYDEICELEKIVFESMLKDYYAARKMKETGAKVVFEADGDGGNNGGNNGGDNGGNNGGNNGGGSTTPEVKTDAQVQHDNSGNNANNNTNGTTKESIVEKFKKWLKDLIDKFVSKSGRLVGRNNKWLASVKADILALDTSNTTISLAKYENVNGDTLVQWTNTAIGKINGINASSIPNDIKTKPKAEAFLFNSIPSKVGNEGNFIARTKQFLTFGNTDQTTLASFSGDDAKRKIEGIIQFCESYENTYKNVSNAVKKLGDAAAKKQQEIINALGTQSQTTTTTTTNNGGNGNNDAKPATESVLMEADNTTQTVTVNGNNVGNDKDSKEKLGASSMIVTVAREYSGAVLTILEKKYLDYIKVLAKLAPQKNKEKPAKQDDSGGGENQEGNNQ